MANTKKTNPMKKKGQIVETIGVIFLLGILVIGGIGSYKIMTDNRFVGNIENSTVYDLKYCDINIPKDNIISFENKEDAYKKGFKDAECNK